MPQPLRKLSQGKVDKPTTSVSSAAAAAAASSAAAATHSMLSKKGPEKSFKTTASVTAEEDQPLVGKTSISRFRDKANADQHHKSDHDQQQLQQNQLQSEVENEEEVILPPPMKPIQDSQAIINNGPTVAASSMVDNSPCKRVSISNTLWDHFTMLKTLYIVFFLKIYIEQNVSGDGDGINVIQC